MITVNYMDFRIQKERTLQLAPILNHFAIQRVYF